MSLIYLTYHNENVYNIGIEPLPEVKRAGVKKKSFWSKMVEKPLPNMVEAPTGKKIMSSSAIADHKTMGYAETPLRPPTGFMKKHEGVQWERMNDHVCPPYERRPPVPKRSEIGDKPRKVEKNFKNANIKNVVCTLPKKPEAKFADTRRGDTHAIKPTGLVPTYVYSQKFGKVPKYLLKCPKKSGPTKGPCKETSQLPDGIKLLSTEERMELLVGLKKNWHETQKTYQGLPVFTDTIPKKLKKANLEKVLKQLEQDILLIESNPMIYVCEEESNKGIILGRNKAPHVC